MDRGAWQAIVYGVTKSLTQLRDWACTHKYSNKSMFFKIQNPQYLRLVKNLNQVKLLLYRLHKTYEFIWAFKPW